MNNFLAEIKKDFWTCGDRTCCYDEWYCIKVHGLDENNQKYYILNEFECNPCTIEDNEIFDKEKFIDFMNDKSRSSHWYIEFNENNLNIEMF